MRFQIDPIKDENQRACSAILAAVMPPSRATIIVYALYAAVVGAAYLITPWCNHVDIRYAWRDITKVTENQEFYVFAGTSGSGAVIPKRLLDDTSESQLRDHIRLWASDRGVFLARKAT